MSLNCSALAACPVTSGWQRFATLWNAACACLKVRPSRVSISSASSAQPRLGVEMLPIHCLNSSSHLLRSASSSRRASSVARLTRSHTSCSRWRRSLSSQIKMRNSISVQATHPVHRDPACKEPQRLFSPHDHSPTPLHPHALARLPHDGSRP